MDVEKKRKHYDDAFKRNAVKTLLESKQSVTAMAVSMGVNRCNLQKWKKQFGREMALPATTGDTASKTSNEIVVIKTEIKELKDTVENLRKIVKRSFELRHFEE